MIQLINNSIPAWTQPRLTMSAPAVGNQDRGDKLATDGNTVHHTVKTRYSITLGTWNVRTLRPQGKVEELIYEMDNYKWNILGISEMRWKGFGELTVQDDHRLYYSGRTDKHQQGVGFLVHKDIVNCIISCNPISNRLITITLNACPFNITLVQVYAPTSAAEEEETEQFYNELQGVLDTIPKKNITILMGDFNAKVGRDSYQDRKHVIGTNCNAMTNENGIKLLDLASYNNLVIANTLGKHKKSRVATWHSPDGQTSNQIDYILTNKRFQSSICTANTRTFPKANVGSDHDLVMMKFKLHLKKIRKPQQTRMQFDLEKLKDPEVAEIFQASIGGKFGPLLAISEDPSNTDTIVETLNTAIIESSSEILGKKRKVKKPLGILNYAFSLIFSTGHQ